MHDDDLNFAEEALSGCRSKAGPSRTHQGRYLVKEPCDVYFGIPLNPRDAVIALMLLGGIAVAAGVCWAYSAVTATPSTTVLSLNSPTSRWNSRQGGQEWVPAVDATPLPLEKDLAQGVCRRHDHWRVAAPSLIVSSNNPFSAGSRSGDHPDAVAPWLTDWSTTRRRSYRFKDRKGVTATDQTAQEPARCSVPFTATCQRTPDAPGLRPGQLWPVWAREADSRSLGTVHAAGWPPTPLLIDEQLGEQRVVEQPAHLVGCLGVHAWYVAQQLHGFVEGSAPMLTDAAGASLGGIARK